MDEQRMMEIFFDIHRGLPRQGPGDDASTRKALSLCTALPNHPAVIDIGCGPGMQTLVLANELDGHITGVDFYPEFLYQLQASAQSAGIVHQFTLQQGDMNNLPFIANSFDLIWSEGAAYIIGISNALNTWREFLKPGGYIVITEVVWLKDNPPAEVKDFWESEYPAIGTIDALLKTFTDNNYTVIDHFTLSDAAWWDNYYTPLEAKLPGLRKKYADDAEALRVIEMDAHEIDIRRRFGEWYSYEFVIAQG